MLELADDVADVVLDVVDDTAELVSDAIEGADELIEGARRAGWRRLLALVIVVAVIAAVVGWIKSRQDDATTDPATS